MKEKRKKIVARIAALVAAVLLVVLCALPCFADGGSTAPIPTNLAEYFVRYYEIGEYSPLYPIVTAQNYNLATHPKMYELGFPQVGESVQRHYITLEDYGAYTTATRVRVQYRDTLIPLGDGWVQTSHTTQSGYKIVYFDFYENYAGDTRRALRIRYKITQDTGVILDITTDSEYAAIDNLDGLDVDELTIGIATTTEANVIEPYGIGKGYFVANINADYFEFEKVFRKTYQDAYFVGYDYAWDWASEVEYNRGYNDGMSQSSLLDGVTAIFRAPMELIDGVLDFNIMGINLAGAVHVIITMAIIGVVVTIIWKAVK